ncbi:MAG: DUF2750 domain-containing protein [Gammaproteobacteria bacterium]|nr:DUF2750 domain-containing protein [Gammaproteobacteria bacterium]
MRYAPSQQELQEIAGMQAAQRLQYFLTRVIEAEEVWSLADEQGWVMRENGDMAVLPIWPYRQCADACITETDLHAHATSLDHFVESILHTLITQNIYVEVLPARETGGVLLSAGELRSMFKSLMESGEYFLEG